MLKGTNNDSKMDKKGGRNMKIYVRAHLVINYIRIAWNYLWWSYHVKRARYHDGNLENIVPKWRDA